MIKIPSPSFDAECFILESNDHDNTHKIPQDLIVSEYDALLLEGYDNDKNLKKAKTLKDYKIAISPDEKELIQSFQNLETRFFNVDIYNQTEFQSIDDFLFFSDFFREITLAQKAAFLVKSKINKVDPKILIHWGAGHTENIIKYIEMAEEERLQLIRKNRKKFKNLFGSHWSSSILEMKPRKKNNNFDVIKTFEEPNIKTIIQ